MPEHTIYLTEMEVAILGVFVQKKILSELDIINTLEALTEKLRGDKIHEKASKKG